jgi:replicative DNA helicase
MYCIIHIVNYNLYKYLFVDKQKGIILRVAQVKIEETILSSFLKDIVSVENYEENLKLLHELKVEYFKSREHQHILRVFQTLDQNNYDLESLIVETKLNKNALDSFINILSTNPVTNVSNYIKILKENYQKVSIENEIFNIRKQLNEDLNLDTQKLIDKLTELQNIKSSNQKKKRDLKFKKSWKNISTNKEKLENAEKTEYINKMTVKGEVTMIAAPPGDGKSLTTLAEIHEALNSNMVDEVYYLDMDNSESTLAQRDLAKIAEKYEDRLFYVLGSSCSKVELDRKIRDLCNTDLEGCYIIFDSAKNFMRGGDRDKNKDVSKITEIFKALRNNGATVKFLHHTNKPQKDFETMFAGSSAWLEDTTNAYILQRNQEKETFIFKNIKKRTGEIPNEIAYKYNRSTLKLDEVEIEDAKLTSEDEDILDDIKIYLLDNETSPQNRTQNKIVKFLTQEGYGRNQCVRLLHSFVGKKWDIFAQDTMNGKKVYTLKKEISNKPIITEFISDDYKSETIPQKRLGQVGQWDIPSTRDFKNTSFKNSSGTGGTINNIDSSQMEIPNIFLGG